MKREKIMGVKRGTVQLEDYNRAWKVSFEKEKELLSKVLKGKILSIEHVGSTSIPGLKAKPIIDICVVVQNLEEVPTFENILKPYGYHFRGHQGVMDRYFFAKGPEESRTHYIHFETINSTSYQNHILFRDYLIKHPEYIEKYEKLKESLARKYSKERNKYTAGKADFIQSVISLAKEERK